MGSLGRSRGSYYEEFEVGDTVETVGRTITESDVVAFAGLTGDYNQLHTDAEFAKKAMFGERVAHGLLVLGIVSGLANRSGFIDGTVEAFTGVEWKFRAPIRIGDTVHARFEVRRKRDAQGHSGGLVYFEVAVLNQRNETVQKGTWTVLMKSSK
ncbi:MAG: MaoC family dehydratase N-terminal domain-containing protein [Anaerolineae bacterium]|nr:MaoC family dehydratase N-terminal domain-containing protein [Anaerolineae bacterium]